MLTRRSLLRSMPALAALPHSLAHAAPGTARLLVGTGTDKASTSKGIYLADWNLRTGELGELILAAPLDNPTWLALSPRSPHLYALSEIHAGKVTAFRLRRGTGHSLTLERLNEQTTQGDGPAHVAVSPDGRSAFATNYGGGSLTSYKIERSGALSAPVSHFQYAPIDADTAHALPHAHQATPSPDGRWLLVNDLGSDRILIYHLDQATGTLTPNAPAFWQGPLQSGPRHLVFHPNRRWVYNVNELNSTVDLLLWNNDSGTLTLRGQPVSTLPPGFPPGTSTCSEILVSPDGRFLYVGNRGHDTIARFNINPTTGALALSQLAEYGGKTARHLTLDPTGRFLLVAAQSSSTIVVLPRDPATGQLSNPTQTYKLDRPQCLVFTT